MQEEPSEALDPERLGLFASIGIEKGKPFAPDARMKKILTEAAAVGNATSRAILFRSRMKDAYFYPSSAWITTFVGGSYEFLSQPGVRNLDARTMFHYYATGITPAMAMKMVGIGSQYAAAFIDSEGKPLDGGKTYKIHLPPQYPGEGLLVIRGLRQSDPLNAADRRNSFRASGARKRASSSIPTHRWMSGSAQPRRKVMSPTGCRPSRAKVGTYSSASMDRCSHGSTRHGSPGSLKNSKTRKPRGHFRLALAHLFL